MSKTYPGYVDPLKYHQVVLKMRQFFLDRGYIESHPQSRLSILAACEDPSTIGTFNYEGQVWPLPQTGQMNLEFDLLDNPEVPGYFCSTTSYRNEPDPVPGRHCRLFPMFEFEQKGDMADLRKVISDLIDYLGFGDSSFHKHLSYEDVSKEYGVSILEASHEEQMLKDFGHACFLEYFPERTSPFWNMKRNDEDKTISEKIDLILYGMETIGSAERSCDPSEMRDRFLSISNGMYAKRLFAEFTKRRVLEELGYFLSKSFIVRSGGGIGVSRMIRAMELHGLLNK